MRLTTWTARALMSVALVATPATARAQAGADWAAAAAVDGYFVAIRSGDWRGAAHIVAPEALEIVKERYWRAAQGDERLWLPGLAGALASPDAWRALDAADVFVALLVALDAAAPEMTAGIDDARILELRQGAEGWADVRVEVTQRDGRATTVRRVTVRVRRDGAGWLVIPPLDLPKDVAKAQRGR